MTPTPEQIDALVKAAEEVMSAITYDGNVWYPSQKLDEALAPFRETEWEYVLPEWSSLSLKILGFCDWHSIKEYQWNHLRELTKRPKAVVK